MLVASAYICIAVAINLSKLDFKYEPTAEGTGTVTTINLSKLDFKSNRYIYYYTYKATINLSKLDFKSSPSITVL